MPPHVLQKVRKQWESLRNLSDAHRQVLELDKLFDYLLVQKGYSGSFSEKMKRVIHHERIDGQLLWYIHKKRNQIAHDIDVHLSESEQKKITTYAKKILHQWEIKV